MLDVIADVRPSQLRVRDEKGMWCDLRLTPYRTADNRIDGVVLTVLGFDDFDGQSGVKSSGEVTSRKAAKTVTSTAKKKKGKK